MTNNPPLIRRLVILAAALMLALPAAPPAMAQLSAMDRGPLIDGLRRWGMRELLEHMIETEPTDDPTVERQVLIGQLLIQYDEMVSRASEANASGDEEVYLAIRQDARAVLDRAISQQRSLITDFFSHEMRPLWQTDLAELLLFVYLPALFDNAAVFYEFGVPTDEQREAYETAVADALEQLAQADVRLFQLQGDLAREPDHVAKRVNTGIWARMMDEYYRVRTQFLMAHAAYYVSLLPDNHPYYRTLGNNPAITQPQRNTPNAERTRLRQLWTIEKLERLARSEDDDWTVRRPSVSLTGRARVANGAINEGLDDLELAVSLSEGEMDFVDLQVKLAQAHALGKAGRVAEAMDLLELLRAHPTARGTSGLFNQLLVLDQTHRVLLAHAQTLPADRQPQARAEAYDIYLEYLQDPGLGAVAEPLRDYVYRRWESTIPAGSDMADEPAAVVVAVGEIARKAGQDLMWEAGQIEGSDSGAASRMRAEARTRLQRSIRLNQQLLRRQGLGDAVRAQAMFNLGFAEYFLDDRDSQQWVDAAVTWTEMADQLPEQPLSSTAIGYACQLLRQLHANPQDQAQIGTMYRRAVEVALTKYAATPAADDERVYFATAVLLPRGELDEAVAVLKGLPARHENYFLAQRALMDAMLRAFNSASGESREQLAAQTKEEAERIIIEAERATGLAAADEMAMIKQASGIAKIVIADIAIAQEDVDTALNTLRTFDQDYGEYAELIGFMLQRRITALFGSGNLQLAIEESNRMMVNWPDAAANVIGEVLTQIEQRIEQLNARAAAVDLASRDRDALRTQSRELSEAGVELGRLLLQWARDRFGQDARAMVPYVLTYTQALRLAGQANEAVTLLEPLLNDPALRNDAGIIHNAAESYFAAGSLTTAMPLYDRIIRDLPHQGGVYPPLWWNAWMRRLQINDREQIAVDRIALNVRQLRQIDPNLGGEPYKSNMERLEIRHTR